MREDLDVSGMDLVLSLALACLAGEAAEELRTELRHDAWLGLGLGLGLWLGLGLGLGLGLELRHDAVQLAGTAAALCAQHREGLA